MACCYNGTLAQPNLNASNNVVLFNTSVGSNFRYGFGMEAGGNLAQYNNILMQASTTNGGGAGLAYDCGPVQSMSNNTVTGSWGGAYIVNESGGNFPCGTDVTPAQLTGNVTGPTNQAYPSQAPSITPAAGAQSFPLTVTMTDLGFTSDPCLWATPASGTPRMALPRFRERGTAQYLATGGTFVLPAAATVKAVGMWGAANQPTSYASGFGFVPSNVVTATYAASAAIRRPAAVADSSTSPTGRAAAAVAATAELPAGAAGATVESVAITPSQPMATIGGHHPAQGARYLQ